MIILNQNKDGIVNFDKIESIWICHNEDGNFTIEATADTNTTLGQYKTEERAKEVLYEIIKNYKGKKLIQFQAILSDEDLKRLNKRYEKDSIYYDLKTEVKQMTNNTYEMPKE